MGICRSFRGFKSITTLSYYIVSTHSRNMLAVFNRNTVHHQADLAVLIVEPRLAFDAGKNVL